jgi:hypothetical protein
MSKALLLKCSGLLSNILLLPVLLLISILGLLSCDETGIVALEAAAGDAAAGDVCSLVA